MSVENVVLLTMKEKPLYGWHSLNFLRI